MKLHRKRNNQIALTRESRPYIIRSRASFLKRGRKMWKNGLKRISCIYVTVVNMSRQDVIMSLLYLYHVAKMSHPPVRGNYAPVQRNYGCPVQRNRRPVRGNYGLDPSSGKCYVDSYRPVQWK